MPGMRVRVRGGSRVWTVSSLGSRIELLSDNGTMHVQADDLEPEAVLDEAPLPTEPVEPGSDPDWRLRVETTTMLEMRATTAVRAAHFALRSGLDYEDRELDPSAEAIATLAAAMITAQGQAELIAIQREMATLQTELITSQRKIGTLQAEVLRLQLIRLQRIAVK